MKRNVLLDTQSLHGVSAMVRGHPLVCLAYCSLLSVIETCRLRKVDPWSYIAQVIVQGRKGILPSPLKAPLEVAAL